MVDRMISRFRLLPRTLLLLCCLLHPSGQLIPATAAVHVPVEGENKILVKFGVHLPASSQIKTKIKRARSRAIHLFIEISANELNAFIDSLAKIPQHPNRGAYILGEDSRVGVIPGAFDWPEDFLNHWTQVHSAKLGLVGYITYVRRIESGESKVEQVESYLVIFADKKKGLIWLYYRR